MLPGLGSHSLGVERPGAALESTRVRGNRGVPGAFRRSVAARPGALQQVSNYKSLGHFSSRSVSSAQGQCSAQGQWVTSVCGELTLRKIAI